MDGAWGSPHPTEGERFVVGAPLWDGVFFPLDLPLSISRCHVAAGGGALNGCVPPHPHPPPASPPTPPSQIDKMFVIKVGELKLLKDGQATTDTAFVHEAGGFSFFGENALQVRRAPALNKHAHICLLPTCR